ncbi:HD domain-containing protein [Zhaonella formicivorans]|uniref:HD domain-containing protein n=1 Tax=Zhaonella formicivorans TaxID=2528593 RepID=UPI0010DEA8F9|nr:HD domain-containing protein [Zhaonella formicivorans]
MSGESKLFRDPIHGFIEVESDILPLLNTKEFQRLRRLTQLGVTSLVYPGAEHSRFGHSLGTMHLFRRIAKRWREKGMDLTEEEEKAGIVTALLHDIGHGPFSHVVEKFLTAKKKHEKWTVEIVSDSTEINKCLRTISQNLPEQVAKIMKHDPEFKVVSSLLSSQLDVDRMDYLLRDAYYTGTSYGKYDLDRLIEKIARNKDRVFIARGGLHAAEQFIFSRYYAYWQVYFHQTTRGFEKLLQKIWQRAYELFTEGHLSDIDIVSSLRPFFGESEISLEQYLQVDNSDFYQQIKHWANHSDPILSDLAQRFLKRQPFKAFIFPKDFSLDYLNRVQQVIENHGYDPRYYILEDTTSDVAYDYYTREEDDEQKPEILIEDEQDGRIKEISKVSDPIKAIASHRRAVMRIYVPDKICHDELKKLN